MKLYSLIYISTPVSPFKPDELEQLAIEAQRNNAAKNITGLLLYSGRIFLQVLEGDYDQLNTLYAKIENDDRHRDMEVLIGAPATRRLFSEWDMGVVDISRSSRIDPDLLRQICDRAEGDTNAAAQAAITLLEVYRHDPIHDSGMTLAQ